MMEEEEPLIVWIHIFYVLLNFIISVFSVEANRENENKNVQYGFKIGKDAHFSVTQTNTWKVIVSY
jgi:hypothetical protein